MIVYSVVTSLAESVVEFFASPNEAEAFVAQVEQDEPETAVKLRLRRWEFERVLN